MSTLTLSATARVKREGRHNGAMRRNLKQIYADALANPLHGTYVTFEEATGWSPCAVERIRERIQFSTEKRPRMRRIEGSWYHTPTVHALCKVEQFSKAGGRSKALPRTGKRYFPGYCFEGRP